MRRLVLLLVLSTAASCEGGADPEPGAPDAAMAAIDAARTPDAQPVDPVTFHLGPETATGNLLGYLTPDVTRLECPDNAVIAGFAIVVRIAVAELPALLVQCSTLNEFGTVESVTTSETVGDPGPFSFEQSVCPPGEISGGAIGRSASQAAKYIGHATLCGDPVQMATGAQLTLDIAEELGSLTSYDEAFCPPTYSPNAVDVYLTEGSNGSRIAGLRLACIKMHPAQQ